jgi:small basic protein
MNFSDLLTVKRFLAPFLGVAIKPGVATVVSGLNLYAPDVYARVQTSLATVSDVELTALIDLAGKMLCVPVAHAAWFGFVVRELHRRAVYAATQKTEKT